MTITRRSALAIAPALALGGARAMAQTEPVPWSTGTAAPTLAAPPGTTDCHHHVYDHRFPLAPGVTSVHPDATAADYAKLIRRLGITRHVSILPSNYGVDNSSLLDALSVFGPSARGIAVVNTDVTDAELRRLDAAGVRGLRFNLGPGSVTTAEMMPPLARRVADLGWNVQLLAAADQIVAMGDMLGSLPCPLVFDHFAHVPQPAGTSHPVFALARRLLDQRKAWVKLSGFYFDSKAGPPEYADTGTVARAYVAAAPERLLWGTGWPHSTVPLDRKPNDAHSFDLLESWIPDPAVRTRILVQNPETLFRF